MAESFEDKIVEVCDKCLRACCWYGEFMCDGARTAGTRKLTVSELKMLSPRENAEYWGAEKMIAVYGSAAPFGYRDEATLLTARRSSAMADGWQHLRSATAALPVEVREEILAFAAEIEIAARMTERERCAGIAHNQTMNNWLCAKIRSGK